MTTDDREQLNPCAAGSSGRGSPRPDRLVARDQPQGQDGGDHDHRADLGVAQRVDQGEHGRGDEDGPRRAVVRRSTRPQERPSEQQLLDHGRDQHDCDRERGPARARRVLEQVDDALGLVLAVELGRAGYRARPSAIWRPTPTKPASRRRAAWTVSPKSRRRLPRPFVRETTGEDAEDEDGLARRGWRGGRRRRRRARRRARRARPAAMPPATTAPISPAIHARANIGETPADAGSAATGASIRGQRTGGGRGEGDRKGAGNRNALRSD